jgi:hypothetical protein
MKKSVILLLFFALSTYCHAQKFDFGLKLNPHVSWFKVDNKDSVTNNGVKFGFSYGLSSEINFSDNYSLSIEILQVFLNAGSVDKHHFSATYKLQNIEIPFFIKMKTNDINDFKYYGEFGLAPSFRTSAKINDQKGMEETKLLNMALVIGTGFYYKLAGSTYAIAGLSLHNNFVPVNVSTDRYKLKPIYIAMDFGVMF